MTRILSLASLALLCAAPLCRPAGAETLQCRSVNGNVTCAGPGAASCQRVDGRTVCVSREGGIVQEFGARPPGRGRQAEAGDEPEERAAEARRRAPGAAPRLRIERQGFAGPVVIEREGGRLRIHTDRLDLDRDD